ncbi:MAG: dTDP-4-dehydrorhamnose reductase [Clostridiales bacterium]|jgi:dTDP-4-dehydrorhamnose reductase|nr:dTDP-4-dehydrorhamnose reductase [Clostridiales bacterium]
MKRVFITGALGQLGRALTGLLKENHDCLLYLTDSVPDEKNVVKKLDITDEASVKAEISAFRPDVIVNCAAMTAVDLCETEQEKAYNINALGPKYIAEAANEINAKLFHISTDYVYDGQADTPYVEESRPNPISVYGRTKLAGDYYVMGCCPDAVILHTSGLYGEGKNFVKTMLRLADEGKSIRVVADQFVTPTSALELARVIVFLMNTDCRGKYHATCEGSTSWYGFACKIFELTGRDVRIDAISTPEYPAPAKRPPYSVLDNKKLRELHGYYMKDWADALKEYLDGIERYRCHEI